MAEVIFDDREFRRKSEELLRRVQKERKSGVTDIANELLRLSQLEVPFDVGFLLQSGNIEEDGEDYLVGYNAPYAAKLHENPQFKFGNGRKGKYLEDPMKRNLAFFRELLNNRLGEVYVG